MPEFVTDRRLMLTADKSRVVEADDPEAAFVLAGEGGTVSHADAERYNLKPPKSATPAADTDDDDAAKAKAKQAPPQTKAVKAPPEDK